MNYDLRREPWIPWRRRSGAVEWAPLRALVSQFDDDPVVSLAAPRPDFDGALQEFLIGLLTVALMPEDESAWRELWEAPPSEQALQAALDGLPPAFDLEGEGPRFFQDLSAGDLAEVEPHPIEKLLIETPGDQTTSNNKDLFIKRDRAARMSRPVAAMALLTLQTYAPAGGQGNRTSLRGGGPLTTLVDPRVDRDGGSRAYDLPLWRKLWANVETRDGWMRRAVDDGPVAIEAAFPWLAQTRTSAKGSVATTPSHSHPLQAYFGMPRRIRLEFGDAGACDLTGLADTATVIGYRARNYGVQYVAWRHPLSPYYRQKTTTEWLPVHAQPGGIGWRDWLALTLRAPAHDGLREPADTVASFGRRARMLGLNVVRVHAYGYDMDNMKARGWTDALLPAFAVEEERQRLLHTTAMRLTEATSMAASALLGAVKDAWFQRRDDARGDLDQVRGDLWAATEAAFYDIMRRLATSTLDEGDVEPLADQERLTFRGTLAARTLGVFDRWCATSGLAPQAMRRHVAARYHLVTTLGGYSPFGEKLYEALSIPVPGGGRAARKKSRSKKESAA